MAYKSPKTIEEYKTQAEILEKAKQGRLKEKRENIIKGIKKVVQKSQPKKQSSQPKKQNTFKKISSAIGYRKSLSSNLMRQFGGQSQSQQSRSVGRPRGSLKHRDPRTGQPIPATLYYKIIRDLNRQRTQQAELQAQKIDSQQIQQLSKRGIPPEQAKQIVNLRQMQSVMPQQNNQQMPEELRRQIAMQQQIEKLNQQQPSSAVRPIWRRQNIIRYERDAFGRTKPILSGNNPANFWQ